MSALTRSATSVSHWFSREVNRASATARACPTQIARRRRAALGFQQYRV